MNEDAKQHEENLRQAARRGKAKQVELYIGRGVDVDARDPASGRTALHWSCFMGESKVVEMLLQAGAKLELANKLGDTALHHAVHGERYHKKRDAPSDKYQDIVKALLTAGANPEARNENAQTPLECSDDAGSLRPVFQQFSTNENPIGTSINTPDQPAEPPYKSRTPMVLLELPHPSVDRQTCKKLRDDCIKHPNRSAKIALQLMDEIMVDICMDNLSESATETIMQNEPPRLDICAQALHIKGFLPPALKSQVEDAAKLAAVLSTFAKPDGGWSMTANAKAAWNLVNLLSEILMWCSGDKLGGHLPLLDSGSHEMEVPVDHFL
mmetsp:Transcript_50167/g.95841  ORF Transcript_50167/g.95841 Transcript_50167/m.95841 type:complete len:325 (+) Transcript_50167:164-1138(+)|eukprot:CAMPEP_0114226032 /NCGR_PEP_ID=MMETSP0058-20121206/1013_1 /TAXON_ID=36894 /ORGANISM="Pyramimonas parkeae, CCMP726" /LENGTH=324 /DNA_ID=CAMNT_0001336725 /DNA_START=120 /DNA_END=1094 /DNA_ORIENTATION=+